MDQKFDYTVLLEPLEKFYKKNQKWIIGITASVALIVFFTILVVTKLQQTHRRAWEKISLSEGYLYQKSYSEGYKLLDEVINNYKNTQYAGYAMYSKATHLYEMGDFNSAKDLCNQLINLKKPKVAIPFTMYLLGQCYQNIQDYKKAIETYEQLIKKFPNHFIIPKVYESLGLTYLLIGDLQNAKSVYDKMNILYPGSYWSNIAQKKLSGL